MQNRVVSQFNRKGCHPEPVEGWCKGLPAMVRQAHHDILSLLTELVDSDVEHKSKLRRYAE